RYCDDGCIVGSAIAFPGPSRYRVCCEPSAEPEAATIDGQVSLEKDIAQTVAERESHAKENGIWSSDRSLVPWKDAALSARGYSFGESAGTRSFQTRSRGATGRS